MKASTIVLVVAGVAAAWILVPKVYAAVAVPKAQPKPQPNVAAVNLRNLDPTIGGTATNQAVISLFGQTGRDVIDWIGSFGNAMR